MTRPPTRLLDSPELSSAERALLDAGKNVAPVHYDVAAGAARFQQTLSTLGTSVGSVGATTSVLTSGITKLALVLVPALGITGAYFALREPARVNIAASHVESVQSPTAQSEGTRVTRELVEVTQPVLPIDRSIVSEGVPRRQLRASRARRSSGTIALSQAPARESAAIDVGSASPSTASSVAPMDGTRAPVAATQRRSTPGTATEAEFEADVAERVERIPVAENTRAPGETAESIDELRGIAQARAKLASDPEVALALLQRVARAHPHGYFVEEREALTVLALAGIGDHVQAQRRGQVFLRKSPRSPFADRVRAAITP